MQTIEVLQSIKQLRDRVQSAKRYGIADLEAVESRVPDEMNRLRKTLPRTEAISQQSLEARARENLLGPMLQTLKQGARAQKRDLRIAIERAKADLERARATARVFAPSIDVTEDEMKDARPIDVATLRELRGLRLRSDVDEARRHFAGLDPEEQITELEKVGSDLVAARERFTPTKEAARAAVHEATKETGIWRDGTIANAKKALAKIESEEATVLGPARLRLHVLQGLVKERLQVIAEPPAGERDPAAFVMRQQRERDARAGRLRDAEDRLLLPDQRRAEAEAADALSALDQDWIASRMILGIVADKGMPLRAAQREGLEPVSQ